MEDKILSWIKENNLSSKNVIFDFIFLIDLLFRKNKSKTQKKFLNKIIDRANIREKFNITFSDFMSWTLKSGIIYPVRHGYVRGFLENVYASRVSIGKDLSNNQKRFLEMIKNDHLVVSEEYFLKRERKSSISRFLGVDSFKDIINVHYVKDNSYSGKSGYRISRSELKKFNLLTSIGVIKNTKDFCLFCKEKLKELKTSRRLGSICNGFYCDTCERVFNKNQEFVGFLGFYTREMCDFCGCKLYDVKYQDVKIKCCLICENVYPNDDCDVICSDLDENLCELKNKNYDISRLNNKDLVFMVNTVNNENIDYLPKKIKKRFKQLVNKIEVEVVDFMEFESNLLNLIKKNDKRKFDYKEFKSNLKVNDAVFNNYMNEFERRNHDRYRVNKNKLLIIDKNVREITYADSIKHRSCCYCGENLINCYVRKKLIGKRGFFVVRYFCKNCNVVFNSLEVLIVNRLVDYYINMYKDACKKLNIFPMTYKKIKKMVKDKKNNNIVTKLPEYVIRHFFESLSLNLDLIGNKTLSLFRSFFQPIDEFFTLKRYNEKLKEFKLNLKVKSNLEFGKNFNLDGLYKQFSYEFDSKNRALVLKNDGYNRIGSIEKGVVKGNFHRSFSMNKNNLVGQIIILRSQVGNY